MSNENQENAVSPEYAERVAAAQAAQRTQYESQVRVTALVQAVASEGQGTSPQDVLATAKLYEEYILNS